MLEKGVNLEGEGQERNGSSEAVAVIIRLMVVPLPGSDGLYYLFFFFLP